MDGSPSRRRFLHTSALLLAAGAGCVAGDPSSGTPDATATATTDCRVSGETALTSVLPPAPDGLKRVVDDDTSDAYLDQYEAEAAVSADYTDRDDAVLDDSTVRAFRFREAVDAERILVEQLNAIEFDSGRVGVGALLGDVGFVAAAPRRAAAERLLVSSSALSERCLDARKVMPAKTRTPHGDDSSPTTATSHE